MMSKNRPKRITVQVLQKTASLDWSWRVRKYRYGASSREKSNKYITEKTDHVELVGKHSQGFSGGPMVRTPRFHAEGPGSFPGQGTKIPQVAWHDQKGKNISILESIKT